jgi:hypothetical protein
VCVGAQPQRSGSQRAQLASVGREHETRLDPRGTAGLHIARRVADHPRSGAVGPEAAEDRLEHAGLGLAAVAVAHQLWVAARAALGVVHARLDGGDAKPLLREALDQGVVRPPHRVGGELTLRGGRLVRRHREDEPRLRQGPHPFDRTRKEADVIRVEGDCDGARLLVPHDVDDGPVAIEDRDPRRHFTLSHFVAER